MSWCDSWAAAKAACPSCWRIPWRFAWCAPIPGSPSRPRHPGERPGGPRENRGAALCAAWGRAGEAPGGGITTRQLRKMLQLVTGDAVKRRLLRKEGPKLLQPGSPLERAFGVAWAAGVFRRSKGVLPSDPARSTSNRSESSPVRPPPRIAKAFSIACFTARFAMDWTVLEGGTSTRHSRNRSITAAIRIAMSLSRRDRLVAASNGVRSPGSSEA